MTIQSGKDLILKITDGASGWVTVGGLRTRELSLGTQFVDITHPDSPNGWRELLGGVGVKKCSLSGSGVFRDGASDIHLREAFFNSQIQSYQLIIPDFGIIEGDFLMTNLTYKGQFDGEMTFDIRLESASSLIFTAV